MKLITLKQCQRDSRWANILLGYNIDPKYNIGNYGCLITSFSMYFSSYGKDENPATVNELLKQNKGYAPDSGNLIWSAIPRVFGLNDVYQSPTYTGPVTDQGLTKMRSFLDQGFPLVTHIDFNPADSDDDMHWVLVNGYDGDIFYCNDPWSGNNVSLDVYGGVRRAVIQFRAYDQALKVEPIVPDLQAELDKVRIQRDENWLIVTAIANTLKVQPVKDILVAEVIKLLSYEDALQKKDGELTIKSQEIMSLQDQVTKLQNEAKQLQDTNKAAQDTNLVQAQEIESQKSQLKAQAEIIRLLSNRIEAVKQDLQIALSKALGGRSGFELIKIGIQKLFGWID